MHKTLIQELYHTIRNQTSEIEIIKTKCSDQVAVQINFVRHMLDASCEGVDNGFAVVLIFHHESAVKLCFQLLKMLVY